MDGKTALFRFYAELNDYLPGERRGRSSPVETDENTSIADSLASQGVPIGEVDLILVNGTPVTPDYILNKGDFVSVFPVFESFDIRSVTLIRSRPLRQVRFIVDSTAHSLALLLEKAGYDVLHDESLTNYEIAALSIKERRILLSRNESLIRSPGLTHARLLRSEEPDEQLKETAEALDLDLKASLHS